MQWSSIVRFREAGTNQFIAEHELGNNSVPSADGSGFWAILQKIDQLFNWPYFYMHHKTQTHLENKQTQKKQMTLNVSSHEH